MDSPDKIESEPSFRKVSSDAASRTYRRPRSDSSSSDENPKHERSKKHSSSQKVDKREMEKRKSHNRSDRHSDRYSRGHYDDYKNHNPMKRYDNRDYKSRSMDSRDKEHHYRDRDRDRDREREKKDHYSRDKERKDYHERDDEKRKRSESSNSFAHDAKPRESKFSKPDADKTELNRSVGPMLQNQSGLGTDLDAARSAAMQAANSVNRNIGASLTTEQKKKMLWGNKKNESSAQDVTKNWDLNLFADRERQEKFNKLMGVKGNVVEQEETKPVVTEAKKRGEDLETDLEKQYTAGLRRRDGRTVGLGL